MQVTINEQAPGQQSGAIAPKTETITVTDPKGRVLTLKEPDVLAPFRLVKIVGAEAAENRVYMNMVFPVLYLAAINGEAVFQPSSGRELDALIQRLGHDGIKSLRAGVEENFGTSERDEEEDAAALKK